MKRLIPTAFILASMCNVSFAVTYLGDLEKGLPALTNTKSLCNSTAVAGEVDCVEAARALCEKY